MDLIRELLYTEVLFYVQIRDVTNRFEVTTIPPKHKSDCNFVHI